MNRISDYDYNERRNFLEDKIKAIKADIDFSVLDDYKNP